MRAIVCSALLVCAATATALGQAGADPSAQAPLDLGRATQWDSAQRPAAREGSTQRMIIDILDIEIPAGTANQVAHGAPDGPWTGNPIRRLWSALAGPRGGSRAAFSAVRTSLWLYPLRGRLRQGVTRSTRVHAYLSALGTSQGEAFEIHLINDGTAPVRIGGDGVVVEPIKKGADRTLRAEMQKAVVRDTGTRSVRANAYCLEYKLNPPERGTLFRVVEPTTQDQYLPAREILRASRRLQQSGQLEPDSNPSEYFHSIRQWAIWVDEQKFTLPKYRDAFVARTKKNVEALGRKWSRQIEDGLTGLVPHRWDEITKILRDAKQPVPGA
jgi:hypothetical protein